MRPSGVKVICASSSTREVSGTLPRHAFLRGLIARFHRSGSRGLARAPCYSLATMAAVTIVMPAYNAAHLLPVVLPAARAALGDGRLLVVDPGSTDDTASVAEQLGAEVLRLGHRAGPAFARNRGVDKVTTDVTLFIDSDCVAHPDVVERVARAFDEDPQLASLTGSYDDTPPERNFFSQYMNLRHHFVHQGARTEDASFWAGCGAVRTSVFREIGGFDAEQFPMPMVNITSVPCCRGAIRHHCKKQ